MTLTVHELLRELRAATQRMSRTNPHRALMLHSMSALMQLAERAQQSPQAEPEPQRVVLAGANTSSWSEA